MSGRAPKGIDRVDSAHSSTGQPHIHFGADDKALNRDGSWHDKEGTTPNITNKIRDWILKNGWNLPK